MPHDGGLYVPSKLQDLRRWLMYTDENTSFQSIAGTLTSAFLNEEFSPIICEKICTEAFPFEPAIKKLEDGVFLLELFHGFTGCHRDFGVSFLSSCLETMLTYNGGKAVFLDYTNGELGSILAHTLKGKKNVKAVVVYKKGTVRGLSEEDLFWNGGNIYPVEIDLPENEVKSLVRQVFSDESFVKENNITVANTANFGRLLPQMFFYPYAFSRIKKDLQGDCYYAMAPGNYSNLVAGLYSWRFALPVGGFVMPATDALTVDPQGNTMMLDAMVNLENRVKADPCDPSNLERLEDIFKAYSLMIRNFVYPVKISDVQVEAATKALYKKFGIFADRHTSRAWAAVMNLDEDLTEDESGIVLVARDDPSISQDYLRHTLGEAPKLSDAVAQARNPFELKRPCIQSVEDLRQIVKEVNK